MKEDQSYATNDLLETDDTIITEEIKQKVAELNHDPVKIYEWVKNNIDYVPYYGSKLGAIGTLYEKRANSWDQSSLLIAMYRAIGIPCRYVTGYIELEDDDLLNWIGVESEVTANEILSFMDLTGNIEDYTTFEMENDTNAVQISNNQITFTDFLYTNTTCYIYKDLGEGGIGDFRHSFSFKINCEQDVNPLISIWMLSNTLGDFQDCDQEDDGIVLYCYRSTPQNLWLILENLETGEYDSVGINNNQEYQIAVYTSGNDVILYLNGEDSVSIECDAGQKRYLYSFAGYDVGFETVSVSGYVKDFITDSTTLGSTQRSMKHVWVEAYMPYSATRGHSIVDADTEAYSDKVHYSQNGESSWIPLDPAYKKYENVFPVKLPEHMSVNALDFFNQYIHAPVEKMPDDLYFENLKAFLSEKYPQYTIDDLTFRRDLIAQHLNVLPTELSPDILIRSISNERPSIPLAEQWQIRINVCDKDNDSIKLLKNNSGTSVDFIRPLCTLYNKRIALKYDVKETTGNSGNNYFEKITYEYNNDQNVACLIPLLSIEGEVFNSPTYTNPQKLFDNGSERETLNIIVEYRVPQNFETSYFPEETSIFEATGAFVAIFVDYNKAPTSLLASRFKKLKNLEEKIDAGTANECSEAPVTEILYNIGVQYYCDYDFSMERLANVMNILPFTYFSNAMMVQQLIQVDNIWTSGTYKLDVYNKKLSWSRLNNQQSEANFGLIRGMTGSAHEHKVFKDMFSIHALSTMKTLRLAQEASDNQLYYINGANYTNYVDSQGGLLGIFDNDNVVDYTFIYNHFQEAGTENDIFLIPKRLTNESEAGVSIGTGYIIITTTGTGYVILNGSGEQINGGRPSINLNTTYIYQDSFNGFQGSSSSSSSSSNYDVHRSSNGHIQQKISYKSESTLVSKGHLETSSAEQTGISNNVTSTVKSDTPGSWESIGNILESYTSSPGNYTKKEQTNTVVFQQTETKQTSTQYAGHEFKPAETPTNNNKINQASDPVDVRTGELLAEATDVEIPGTMPIVIKRNYSSQQESFDFIGYGWTLNLNYYLWANIVALDLANDPDNESLKPESMVLGLTEYDGSVIEYNYYSDNDTTVTLKPDLATNPELANFSDSGVGASSSYLGNQIVFYKATGTFVYHSYTGLKKTFVYAKHMKDGEVVKERLYLTETEDLNGNYLKYEYYDDNEGDINNNGYGLPKRITNKSGSYVDFQYEGEGRVSKITSSDKREVQYFYDNLLNLVKVIDPAGKVTQYEYARSEDGYLTHNLCRIIKPENRILENIYDDEQVIEQRMSMGFDANPKHASRMAYGSLNTTSGEIINTVYNSIYEDNGSIYETTTEYKFEDLNQKNSECILSFNDSNLSNSASNQAVSATGSGLTYTDQTCVFGSTSAYLNVPVSTMDAIQTIEFSFKYPDNDTTQVTIYSEGSHTIKLTPVTPDSLTVTAAFATKTLTVTSSGHSNMNWYHLSVILDDAKNELSLYLNGLLVHRESNVTATTLISGTGSAQLKLTHHTGNNGSVDDVGFYSIPKAPGRQNPLRLISTTEKGFDSDSLNIATTRVWAANGNLTSVTDPNGTVTNYAYDTYNRIYTVTVNQNEVTTYTYASDTDPIRKNKVATIIDPEDTKTMYTYDDGSTYFNGALTAQERYTYFPDNESYPAQPTYKETYTYNNKGLISSKTIAAGTSDAVTYSYKYDRFGNMISSTDPEGNKTEMEYDEWGNRIRVTDPLGNSQLFYYDNANNLIKSVDPLGNKSQFVYDKNNNRKASLDANGGMMSYLYDYSDSLLGVMDPLSQTALIEYDIFGNKIFVVNQKGNFTEFEYDGANRLSKQINFVEDGNDYIQYETHYTYDNNNNVLQKETIENINGDLNTIAKSTFSYNHRNQVTTQKSYVYASKYTKITYEYDAVGNKTREYYYDNDTLQSYVSYVYSTEWNGAYLLKSLTHYDTDNDGLRSESYTYDKRGNVISKTNPNGVVTEYEYDDNDRLIKETVNMTTSDDDDIVTEYKYDIAGRLIEVIDPNGHSTRMEYDRNGQLVKSIDPEGRVTQFEYDAMGNKTKEISPTGKITVFVYDALNRLTEVHDEEGNVSYIVYDELGNKSVVIDADNNVTEYEYDELNRITRTVDPLGYEILYEYSYLDNDSLDNDGFFAKTMQAQINESDYRESTWVTDWLGRTVRQIDGPAANQKITDFSFDHINNITQKITPNADTITFTYDDLGNLITASCATDFTVNAEFAYDNDGNRLSMADSTGMTSYKYDNDGRLIIKIAPDNKTVTYAYDKAGNRSKMTFTGINRAGDFVPDNDTLYPSAPQTVTYYYNDANQLTEIYLNGASVPVASYDYNYGGLLDTKTYANGTAVSYSYDALDRLIELTNGDISSQRYEYDVVGNKTRVITERDNQSYVAAYRYDRKNQLIEEVFHDTNSTIGKHSYTYDGTGNRTAMTDIYGAASVENTYTYNTLNELTTLVKDTTTSGLTQLDIWGLYQGLGGSVTVDENAAVINDETGVFMHENYSHNSGAPITIEATKDCESQSVTLTLDADSDACYTYDNNGNLIMKSQNGRQTIFSWDALNRLTDVHYLDNESVVRHEKFMYNGNGERVYVIVDGSLTAYVYDGAQCIAEYDSAGVVTSQYVHGMGLGADVGSMLCSETRGTNFSATTRYFCYNWRGDVIDIADSSGDAVNWYRYDAFGTVIDQSGSADNDMLFSSKRFDASTSLSYFGARYYDASLGRFISRDPMGFIDGPNEFVFVGNNPILLIDPLGLENWLIVVPGTNIKNGNSDMNIPDWSKGNSQFVKELESTLGVKDTNTMTLIWSGANNSAARTDGAKGLNDLASQIRAMDKNAHITVYGHSHGGNVIMESTSYGAKFNTVVTAGTPVRDDYLTKYNRNNVDTHIQLYDTSDMVQISGGDALPKQYAVPAQSSIFSNTSYNIPLSAADNQSVNQFEVGPARREIPGAQNIQVETGSDPFVSHSKFNDPNVFSSGVKTALQNTSYSVKGGRCP
jgi:RHS repeat-associated protein